MADTTPPTETKRLRIVRVAERRRLSDIEVRFYVAQGERTLDPGWAIVRKPDGTSATVFWDPLQHRWVGRAYDGGELRVAPGWERESLDDVADWVSEGAAYARLRREISEG